MKATGIVRRIDDLGRVVIPKEIRRTLRIREGDPLEIYTERDGEVIFKKYSPMGEMMEFAEQICESLNKATDRVALMCDRDTVIAVSGAPKRDLADKRISPELESIMEMRKIFRMERGGEHRFFSTWQSVSSDGGRTFSRPEPLVGPQGGAPAHLLLHSGGTLISVYGYRQAPYGIRAMLSRDGGETWETDWILDDECDNGDLGYPATVELKDGSLLTVYYQNVNGVSRIMQRVWKLPG